MLRRSVHGYRPFVQHTPPSLILALDYAQKLSPSINVELVGSLEVFRHHAKGSSRNCYWQYIDGHNSGLLRI
jgi:hypothetical protein